jgi:hypothetical protein
MPVLFKFKERPTAASVSGLLTPKVSRNHPGVMVAIPALTMDAAPKMVIVAQTKPAGPLLPSAKDGVEVDPINEVSAAISIRPLLKPNELEPESDPVEFAIVPVVDLDKECRESESKRLLQYIGIYTYRIKG